MPTEPQHLAKALNNRSIATALGADPTDHTATAWALTVLFYSALHYIEAFNSRTNFHGHTHQQVNDQVRRNPVLEAIKYDYRDLQNFSWNARYDTTRYSQQHLDEALQFHENIRRHVQALLT